MSDLYDDDDSNLVKDLRKQLEAAKKAQATAEATAAELKGAVRQRTLAEVLTSKGVNAKVAALIPTDVEGDEAVGKWLDDYADVFGITVAAPAAVDGEDDMRSVQSATSTGNAAIPGREAAEEQSLNEAKTTEEWMARAKAISAGQLIDPNA